MTATIATTSREAILVPHYTDADPAALNVKFAFVAVTTGSVDTPAIDDTDTWHTGTWASAGVLQTGGQHRGQYLTNARIVVGPGSDVDTLEPGRYRVFTWVDDALIDPVKRAGDLVITD